MRKDRKIWRFLGTIGMVLIEALVIGIIAFIILIILYLLKLPVWIFPIIVAIILLYGLWRVS